MNHEYDNIARFYDWVAGWTLMPARRELAAMAQGLGAKKVVDIGCGTGLQVCELARLGIKAVGVDSSPAMLTVARQRVATLPKDQSCNVRLELASDFTTEKLCSGFTGSKTVAEEFSSDFTGNKAADGFVEQKHSYAFTDQELPYAFDLAIISLVLHESQQDPCALLNTSFSLAPKVFILDWGMPERNLEYPMHALVLGVERLAGKRHYESYRAYMRGGALEGLVQRYLRQRSAAGLAVARVASRKQLAMNTMLCMNLEMA